MPATAGLRGKRKVHYLVPPTPVALVFWNHRVAGNLVVGYSISAQLGIFALTTYCAVPPITVPLSVSTSNSSVPPFTKTVLKWSADDPLGVICSVPVQSDASV